MNHTGTGLLAAESDMSGRDAGRGQQPGLADRALLALGEIPHDNPREQSWYLSKLPDDLNNVRILRKLDRAGYIVRGYAGGHWASPERAPDRTAPWERFVERKDETGFAARIRLAGGGYDKLEDLREGVGGDESARSKPGRLGKRGRPKGSRKLDDLDRFVKATAKRYTEKGGRIPVKELIVEYADQSGTTVSYDKMRGRMRRALGRVS